MQNIITATYLKQWADTKDCQENLPLLVKKLIRATNQNIDFLTVPSGDSVHLPGWDGVVDSDSSLHNVNAGRSVWEFGCEKEINPKADSDYNKRCKNTLGETPSETTFVFVTPREWTKASSWVKDKKKQNIWKNIVVLTAVELEDWISQHPAISLWLAERLGKLSADGVETLEHWWNNWNGCSDYTLPYSIILSGRKEESGKVLVSCLEKSQITIQASSESEGIAFATATILAEEDSKWKEDALVVTDTNTLSQLCDNYSNLILITPVIAALSYSASEHHHSIIQISTRESVIKGAIMLPLINRDGFVSALESMGIDNNHAHKLSVDTARDINILRRKLGIDKTQPEWAKGENIADLIPAILVGRWDERCPSDKDCIEKLSDVSYREYLRKIGKYISCADSPFIKIDHIYRLKSQYEAFNYASEYILNDYIQDFKSLALDLLNDVDAGIVSDMDADFPSFRTRNYKYSSAIKEGVYQTLVLMSISRERFGYFGDCCDEILLGYYKEMDLTHYLSNSHYLTILTEASPRIFLKWIESDIENGSTIMSRLYESKKSRASIFGSHIHYAELLFALESISWNPEYLLTATKSLLNMCQYKHEKNIVNSPFNSLVCLYRTLMPQTYATSQQRTEVLQRLSMEYPDDVFKLTVATLKYVAGQCILEQSFHFRWRLFENPRNTSDAVLEASYVRALVQLMLKCAGDNIDNVQALIEISIIKNISAFSKDIVKYLLDNKDSYLGKAGIIAALRKEIIRQKQHPDAFWALSPESLQPYEELLEYLEPTDKIEKNLWLFEEDFLQLPEKHDYGDDYLNRTLVVRADAINSIISDKGLEGFWKLANMVKCPSTLVQAYIKVREYKDIEDIYGMAITSGLPEAFVSSFYSRLYYDVGEEKYIAYVKQFWEKNPAGTLKMMISPGYSRQLSLFVESEFPELKNEYWKQVRIWNDDSNLIDVCNNLMDAERYTDVIKFIFHTKDKSIVPHELMLSAIQNLLYHRQVKELISSIHETSRVIKELDKSEDEEIIRQLILIEFLLYNHLNHIIPTKSMRLVKCILHQPSTLMELIEMVYKRDENTDKAELTKEEVEQKANFSQLAYIIFNNLHEPLCSDENGHVAENELREYLKDLQNMAAQRHIVKSTNEIIGRFLAYIPEDDNYPPEYLCDLMDELNNKDIDRGYSMQMYNNHGMSTRAYNEGGTVERALIARYETYRNRVQTKSSHLTKIYNDLIEQYTHQMRRLDEEALTLDLDN